MNVKLGKMVRVETRSALSHETRLGCFVYCGNPMLDSVTIHTPQVKSVPNISLRKMTLFYQTSPKEKWLATTKHLPVLPNIPTEK